MKEMLKKILGFIMVYESVKETKILLKKELKIFKKILFNIIFREYYIKKIIDEHYNIIPITKADKLIKEHYKKVNTRVLKDIDYKYLNMCDKKVLEIALSLRYSYTRILKLKSRR